MPSEKKTKARSRRLTDLGVQKLRAPGERGKSLVVNDTQFRGLYINVSGSTKTWRVRHRENGATSSFKLGRFDKMTVAQARDAANSFKKTPQAFLNPAKPEDDVEAQRETFGQVADDFLKRYAQDLLSASEYDRMLRTYVYPDWKDRPFKEIRRRDVSDLMDGIIDGVVARHGHRANRRPYNGKRQADVVLAIIRKMFNWYAEKDEDYSSPIPRGMSRIKKKKKLQRKRKLDDKEIAAVWSVAKQFGVYGQIIRFALLTAQRKEKIVSMQYSHLANGVWTIPFDEREKGHIGLVKLPRMALDVLEENEELAGNKHVFPAGRGDGPFHSWSQRKRLFDAALEKILPDMPPWTVHDLRRTARTLMSRAGVSSQHAERVMGHVIQGVEGVYDVYDYQDEKSVALDLLAKQLNEILADNHVSHRRTNRPITGLSASH